MIHPDGRRDFHWGRGQGRHLRAGISYRATRELHYRHPLVYEKGCYPVFCFTAILFFAFLITIVASGSLQSGPVQEEEEHFYQKWFSEDALYIIQPEERDSRSEINPWARNFWRRFET